MKEHRDILVSMIGWFLLVLAVASLVGKATGQEWIYRWSRNDVGMALNTALCFAVTGLGLILLGRYMNNGREG